MKKQFVIYADLECIIEKIDGCKNNPKINPSFRSIGNKHDVYRGKDCIKKFCEFLRKHPMRMINFKKKKLKLLVKQQQESYKNEKICYICKEKFENKYLKNKKI